MTTLTPIQHEASIVIMGSFNPAIFRPSWFIQNGMVGPGDIDESKAEFVTPEIARFRFAMGLIEVVSNRFLITTKDPGSFGRLRDLVVSIFTTLSHTPVQLLGMNGLLEYRLLDEGAWKAFGDVLARKDIWQKALPAPVGLMNMTVQAVRDDGLKGYTHVRIDGTSHNGIRYDINNHIELEDGGTQALLQTLSEHWDRLQDNITQIAETAFKETLACIPR
jgi:hypothetical protein